MTRQRFEDNAGGILKDKHSPDIWQRVLEFLGLTCLIVLLAFPVQKVEAQEAQRFHTVQAGDTLAAIAARYGTTVETLVSLNEFGGTYSIFVGQALRIPSQSTIVPQPSPVPTCGQTHVVQGGEGLYFIGVLYGVSAASIAQANGIANIQLIYVGRSLCIPGPQTPSAPRIQPPTLAPSAPLPVLSGLTYEVKGGDTLFGIALAHGLSVDAFIAANGITDPSLLRPGQILQVPGGGVPPVPSPVAAPAPTPIQMSLPIPSTEPTTTTEALDTMPLLRLRWDVSELRVRAGPQDRYEIETVLRSSQVWYEIIGQVPQYRQWWKIAYGRGETGWVNGRFVETQGDLTAVPAIDWNTLPMPNTGSSMRAVGSSPKAHGIYLNSSSNWDGEWTVQRQGLGRQVTATFSSERSPVAYHGRRREVLFVLPEGFWPLATVQVTVRDARYVDQNGDYLNEYTHRFDMSVDTDGEVRYVNNGRLEGIDDQYLEYVVNLGWSWAGWDE